MNPGGVAGMPYGSRWPANEGVIRMNDNLLVKDLGYDVAPFGVSSADVGAIVRSVESSGDPELYVALG